MLDWEFTTQCNISNQMFLLYALEWQHLWVQYYYVLEKREKERLLNILEL